MNEITSNVMCILSNTINPSETICFDYIQDIGQFKEPVESAGNITFIINHEKIKNKNGYDTENYINLVNTADENIEGYILKIIMKVFIFNYYLTNKINLPLLNLGNEEYKKPKLNSIMGDKVFTQSTDRSSKIPFFFTLNEIINH